MRLKEGSGEERGEERRVGKERDVNEEGSRDKRINGSQEMPRNEVRWG